MENFLVCLAWPTSIMCFLFICICIYCETTYTDLQKAIDRLERKAIAHWPIGRWLVGLVAAAGQGQS